MGLLNPVRLNNHTGMRLLVLAERLGLDGFGFKRFCCIHRPIILPLWLLNVPVSKFFFSPIVVLAFNPIKFNIVCQTVPKVTAKGQTVRLRLCSSVSNNGGVLYAKPPENILLNSFSCPF